MSRRASQQSRHKAMPVGKRRKTTGGVRRKAAPRYRRITMAGGALSVTALALLGGTGIISVQASNPTGFSNAQADAAGVAGDTVKPVDQPISPSATPSTAPTPRPTAMAASELARKPVKKPAEKRVEKSSLAESGDVHPALPADSGEGRRAVFDISDQRVWIVGHDGTVKRTYLVSGSLTDNLGPGSYEVYSRSRNAWGIDDSGEMEYFVRFTHGDNAAIGFHSIPTKDGRKLQTRGQLGTPQSHGCIRQDQPDAIAMWEFAQLGTDVVVTA